jgi:hypothetical protein
MGPLPLKVGGLFSLSSDGENPAAGIPIPPDVQRDRFLDKLEIKKLVEVLVKDENQVADKANPASASNRGATQ